MVQTHTETNRARRRAPRGLRAPLGTFQYIVMHAIQRLGDEAYGMAIENYIITQIPELASSVDLAQIYVTTKRLVESGLLEEPVEGPAPGGSKHTVKLYRVSEDGACALKEAATFFAAVANLKSSTKGVVSREKRKAPAGATHNKRVRARSRPS